MCPIDPAACLVLASPDEAPTVIPLTEEEWREVSQIELAAVAGMLALAVAGMLIFAA